MTKESASLCVCVLCVCVCTVVIHNFADINNFFFKGWFQTSCDSNDIADTVGMDMCFTSQACTHINGVEENSMFWKI